jgi:hypothetical protein
MSYPGREALGRRALRRLMTKEMTLSIQCRAERGAPEAGSVREARASPSSFRGMVPAHKSNFKTQARVGPGDIQFGYSTVVLGPAPYKVLMQKGNESRG